MNKKLPKHIEEQILKIVTTIFYSPASNGKAEQSILEGVKLVKSLLSASTEQGTVSLASSTPNPSVQQKTVEGHNILGSGVFSALKCRRPSPQGTVEESECVDFQQQIEKHIAEYNHFNWHEALTENEMSYLVDLMLTFKPDRWWEKQIGAAPQGTVSAGSLQNISIPLNSVPGHMTVSAGASGEVIDALNKMAELAYNALTEKPPQGTVEETTDDDIAAIEHIYDVFSNWYHDDGDFDTFLRSEALKAINAYAATKSASSTPNPSVQQLIEKWEGLSVDSRSIVLVSEILKDLRSLQSQTNSIQSAKTEVR